MELSPAKKQAALRQGEAQLSSVFETIPDGIIILDVTGRIVAANKAAEQLLRLDQDHLADRTYNDLTWAISTVDGQPFPEDELPFVRVMRTGQPVYGVEHAITLSDSTRAILSVNASPLFDPAGQITHVVAALCEITDRVQIEAERQQAEQALRQSEQLYRSVIETAAEGIVLQKANGDIYTCNANAEHLLGLTADQMTGRSALNPTWRAIQEDGTPFPPEQYPATVTLRTGQPLSNVIMGIYKPDDTLTWISINTRPLFEHPGPQPGLVVVTFFEITDRKQAEEEYRQRLQAQSAHAVAEAKQEQASFLADVSAALSSSLEYEQTLQRAAELAVPYFADWCSIDLLNPDNSISRMAVAHCDPIQVERAWEVTRRFPRSLEQDFGISRVIQTGQPQLVAEITDEMLTMTVKDPDYLATLRQFSLRSCIIMPLQARDRVLGSISFVFTESDRRYSAADLPLAHDLAQRVAIAIDNAGLYQAAQQSRQLAEAAADRTARLQTVTAALSEVLSPQQLADVIVEQSMAALDADAAMVALVTPDQKHLAIVKAEGYDLGADLVAAWQQFAIDAPVPLAEAVRTGQPVWLGSPSERAERYPHLAEYYNRYDFSGWLSLPLKAEGRAVGGISLSFRLLRPLSQTDQDFILAVSRQCAQAILRAQLYEAERQARTEAERANRVKDEFLAILSHELRSPLNPILGWSQLLQTHTLSETKTKEALSTIERNAKLQTQLIDDLLDIAKILRGKLHLDHSPIDLTLVIDAALETVKTAALAKAIVLNPVLVDVGKVYGDAARLQQVVWNLLSNAIKFTPQGGRVEVRLEQIEDQAQITVTDTGKGIHPDFLPHLFQSFRQEDVSITRQYGGLGLGLAIVRHLVEAHGGTISASSPGEGLGATFAVQLPTAKTTSPTKPAERPVPSRLDLGGVRVLVVDDDPDARELVAFMLSQYGAEVMSTASAAEALATLETAQPSVLVSDIGMPDMDGYTLIKQIRALPPERGGQVPAIALTAYTREADQQQALASGYQRHLSKPFEVELLVKTVLTLAVA
ncbi:ATP-binding protein [Nodosilinea sp. LEGE 06152]|uniref:ATP-binding protein n=1 Tax=Nodosilinea sp. LEGE 06152 TaxID=2777966 RepID=UPI001D1459E7|nr:ATP-binding protein [Nodosilinea sp. LEGE 06152]